ncbi:hypothetical protein JXO59_04700 [candidate division KSB1 bacterium]|nr:hypothetical protein [candidate division KSB1 bacterium]
MIYSANKYLGTVILFISLALTTFLQGALPVIRTYKSTDDLISGKMENVSLLDDGRLCLSPVMTMVFDTGDPYIWAMARDLRGNLYLGTGNDGRVYKITAQGDTSLFFDAPEFEVYALAVDKQDHVYAATSPNGKIYRIKPDGTNEIFFQPDETYIWDIELDADGDLIVATGSTGKLIRVKSDGSSKLIHSSETEHIRCIAINRQNRLYWGTSSPGLIYCLLPQNKPYVVHDPGAEEVHDISIADDGMIFAAVFTERERPRPGQQITQEDKSRETPESEGETVLSSLSMLVEEALGAKTKTQLLMITPDGYAKNLWRKADDVQALQVFDNDVLVGTNNKGRIFRVTRSGETSVVNEVETTHVSALLKTNDDILFIATSNMGRCYRSDPSLNDRGTYESQTIDAGNLADWGVVQWQGKGMVTFATRSGNTGKPENTWSKWENTVTDQGILRIKSPAARFLQWRCELQNQKTVTPEIRQISLSYIQKNLPPEIGEITIHPHHDYISLPRMPSEEKGIVEPQTVPKAEEKKGYRSVDWQFSDPNHDALEFDVYYRKTEEKYWHLLVKGYAANYYSWDTYQLQDGIYQLKIVAFDGCHLPADEGLTSEKISQAFVVDNTGPVIKDIRQQKRGTGFLLSFAACDEGSALLDVHYSVNAGGWQSLNPVDGICDSPCETFHIELLQRIEQGEITIKAKDRFNNSSIVHATLNPLK